MSDTGSSSNRRVDENVGDYAARESSSPASCVMAQTERSDEDTGEHDDRLSSYAFRSHRRPNVPGICWPSFCSKTVTLRLKDELFMVDEELFFEVCASKKLKEEWENSARAILDIPSTLVIHYQAVVHWLVMIYNPAGTSLDVIKIVENTYRLFLALGEIWVLANHFGDWQGQNRIIDALFYQDGRLSGNRDWIEYLTSYITKRSNLPVQSSIYQWLVDYSARYWPYDSSNLVENSTDEFRTLVLQKSLRFRGCDAPPMSASDYYVARPE